MERERILPRRRDLFVRELASPKPGTGKPGGPQPVTTLMVGEEKQETDGGPRD